MQLNDVTLVTRMVYDEITGLYNCAYVIKVLIFFYQKFIFKIYLQIGIAGFEKGLNLYLLTRYITKDAFV